MPRSYEERVADFEKKYGFEEGRVEKFFDAHRKLRSISKYYLNINYSKSSEELYREGLRTLLRDYAENQIKPATVAKDYGLDFNAISGIITDYEKLMQARHEKLVKENPDPENKPQPRQQFEGNLQKVIDDVRDLSKTWQTNTLSSAWLERLQDGRYDVSDMRKITKEAYNNGRGFFVESDDFTVTRVLDENGDEVYSTGETVAMMRDVMERLTQSRPTRWYWNPLNWWQAIKESIYKRELNKQINGSKGELRPINTDYRDRAGYTLIYGEDKTKLYSLLKNTEKQMKQDAERAEFRRQKEEEKAKQEALEKEKANEINANKDANVIGEEIQNGEKVEFGDVFKEENVPKSPVIQNEEKKEITKVME